VQKIGISYEENNNIIRVDKTETKTFLGNAITQKHNKKTGK